MNEHGTYRPSAAVLPEGDGGMILGQMLEWVFGQSSEVITAWATVFIAGCALWVARNQAQAARQQVEDMREHNRLSVTPSLVVTSSRGLIYNPYVAIKLSNAGTGPAIIKCHSLFFKDTDTNKVMEIPADNKHLFNEFHHNFENKIKNKVNSIRIISGNTIAANEEIVLLSFNVDKNNENLLKIADDYWDNINILIKYQSIYKDEIFTFKTECEYDFVAEAAKNED